MRNPAAFELFFYAVRKLHEPQPNASSERADAEAAFAAGELAAITSLKVICRKCYTSRLASLKRCPECGDVGPIYLEEQKDE